MKKNYCVGILLLVVLFTLVGCGRKEETVNIEPSLFGPTNIVEAKVDGEHDPLFTEKSKYWYVSEFYGNYVWEFKEDGTLNRYCVEPDKEAFVAVELVKEFEKPNPTWRTERKVDGYGEEGDFIFLDYSNTSAAYLGEEIYKYNIEDWEDPYTKEIVKCVNLEKIKGMSLEYLLKDYGQISKIYDWNFEPKIVTELFQ